LKALPRSFYERDTVTVARELLGKHLVRRSDEGKIVAKIVEVEAYGGRDDPASHAYRGETPRSRLMFGKGGYAYVYFIYGNHHCFNVTTGREGVPGAVLIRAAEPVEGIDILLKNRRTKSLVNSTNGPGKMTKAMNITKLQNGLDLTQSQDLFISEPETEENFTITSTDRIGVRAGAEKPWRFYIRNNKFVSRK